MEKLGEPDGLDWFCAAAEFWPEGSEFKIDHMGATNINADLSHPLIDPLSSGAPLEVHAMPEAGTRCPRREAGSSFTGLHTADTFQVRIRGRTGSTGLCLRAGG